MSLYVPEWKWMVDNKHMKGMGHGDTLSMTFGLTISHKDVGEKNFTGGKMVFIS
jgi:hypothetical protein